MKKLPSKALIYRDWKVSKWFMLLLFFELFFFFMPDFIVNTENTPPTLRSLNEFLRYPYAFFFLMITIALMSATLFFYDRKLSNYTLAASMPFQRHEIIKSKWLVGIYNLFIPCVSMYVVMNAMLIINFCWKAFFIHITKWFFLMLLFQFCIFGFVTLAQSLNGSAVFGSLVTMLLAAFPFTILYQIYGILSIYYGLLGATGSEFERPIVSAAIQNLFEMKWFSNFIRYSESYLFGDTFHKFISDMNLFQFFLIMVFLFALILLFYFLSWKFFRKSHLEKTGSLTTTGNFDKLYKIVMAYSAGFLIHKIYFIFTSSTPLGYRPDFIILFSLLLPIPLYFLIGYLIKHYNKRFS
ncbi:MAG: hypothetical protein N2645_18015 [Clostridia bacterium]|nr:hypothetical protein [Clostridia bacterium]